MGLRLRPRPVPYASDSRRLCYVSFREKQDDENGVLRGEVRLVAWIPKGDLGAGHEWPMAPNSDHLAMADALA